MRALLRRTYRRRTLRRALALSLVIAAIFAALLIRLTGFGHDDGVSTVASVPSVPKTDRSVLTVSAPRSIQAGTATKVLVRNTGDADQVNLIVFGSAGTITNTAQPRRGTAEFALTSDTTRLAGAIRLVARAGDRMGTGTMTIRPGRISNMIDPIVGPRSIIADGRDTTMSVAFPMDVLGNVAEDGTPVDLHLEHADGTSSGGTSLVKGLLAFREFRSKLKAGNTDASARAKGESGRAFAIRETPSVPLPFSLRQHDILPVADGFTLVRISTTVVKDVNDNIVEDGTAVIFTWDGPLGRSRQVSKTLSGIAELVFDAPSSPSTLIFQAWSLGTTSSPLKLTFQPATTNIPMRITRNNKSLTVHFGPVLGDNDSYVRDGTRGQITISDETGKKVVRDVQLVAAGAIHREPLVGFQGTIEVRVSVLGLDRALRLKANEVVADTGGVSETDQIVAAARTDIVRETATEATDSTIATNIDGPNSASDS